MPADPPFDQSAEPERLRAFVAELEADGFKRVASVAWEGPIRRSLVEGGHTDADGMVIIVRPSWPYVPPLIHVPGIAAWHADQEKLCIWQADDNSQRWVTLQGLYDRVDEWVADADRGFAGVENARNPEIYWQEPWETVVGLVNMNNLLDGRPGDGQHGEFHFTDATSADGRRSPVVVYDLRAGAFTAMTNLPNGVEHHRYVRGRWLYRSSLPHPPRTLDELRSFLTEKQLQRLDKDLRDRPLVMFGLFWPNQAGLVGTVLLSQATADGERTNYLVALRPKGRDALLLRAGPDAEILQQSSVAVLGVGAIGSHVAEQLVRAGIGRLRLLDGDLLWPTNLIRHAAPPGTPAATPKTVALKEHLAQYPWIDIDLPDPGEGYRWTIAGLTEALESADLTIDATGHAGLAELAARVAHDAGRDYVSVALFRGGSVARIRRQARDDDTPLLQRPHLDAYPEIPPLTEEAEYVGTETGCLAHVHNAPPVSVALAAALAAEVAIDHLSGRSNQPDEIIEVIRPGDPPFDRPGRMRAEDMPLVVDVSEAVQGALRSAAADALPKETGGILLGCIIDGRPVVASAVDIIDREATPSSYHVPAGATLGAVAQARERDGRLGYLGEWHSHPCATAPSFTDLATMLTAAQDSGIANPVLIVVHPDEDRPGDLRAHVTTPAGLKAALICTTGDLAPAHTEGET